MVDERYCETAVRLFKCTYLNEMLSVYLCVYIQITNVVHFQQ